MRLLILCAMFSVQAFASVDAAKWNKLVADVSAKGASMTMSDGTEFRYFQNLPPNSKAVSHNADYFSVHGETDATGKFVPLDIDEVFETWKLNSDSSWSITQYLIEMDKQGTVTSIYYGTFTEKNDGAVSDDNQKKIDSADPAALAVLQSKLAGWYAFDSQSSVGQ